MTDLEKALVKTIAWFDIFNYPLTDWEVWKYLWLPRPPLAKGGYSYHAIKTILLNPSSWLAERIENQGAWYFLQGRLRLIERRHKQHLHFRKRWARAQRMAQRAAAIPFLQTFALCNTFALENANRASDLDVFVITRERRIWIVRPLLTALAFILKKWRHKKRIANRFCLSFFISSPPFTKANIPPSPPLGKGGMKGGSNLNLSKIAQQPYDIYLIYWIALLAPLYGKEKAQEFFKANDWIRAYLPNWQPRDESRKYETRPGIIRQGFKHFFELVLSGPIGNRLNIILGQAQRKYMQRKQTHTQSKHPNSTVISDSILKFHPEDRREHFRKLWENKVSALL